MHVDPRVELVSALFRAGGRPEYNAGKIPRWNAALDSLARANRNHDALIVATRLAGQYNVGFFAPVSLAIHLRTDSVRLDSASAQAASLHRTWKTFPDSTRAFVAAFAAFAHDARFSDFLGQQREVVQAAERSLGSLVARRVRLDWFPGFWGDTAMASLTIVPGLTTGTASYGLDVALSNGRRDGYAIIGVVKVDAAGLPAFDSTDVNTVVHELNHPYLTAVLRSAPRELRTIADSLFAGVAPQMRRMGYGSADAMLNEALVRAAVVRYLSAHAGPSAAETEIEAQRSVGFVWIRTIVHAMAEYESRRDNYPTFTAFLPTLAERLRAARSAD